MACLFKGGVDDGGLLLAVDLQGSGGRTGALGTADVAERAPHGKRLGYEVTQERPGSSRCYQFVCDQKISLARVYDARVLAMFHSGNGWNCSTRAMAMWALFRRSLSSRRS